MQRMGLTMRIRTTYKEASTERMTELKLHYQGKVAPFFHFMSHHNIFNCDKTSVFYDAPHNRTIDSIGAAPRWKARNSGQVVENGTEVRLSPTHTPTTDSAAG